MTYELCPKKGVFRWDYEQWNSNHEECQSSHYMVHSKRADCNLTHSGRR